MQRFAQQQAQHAKEALKGLLRSNTMRRPTTRETNKTQRTKDDLDSPLAALLSPVSEGSINLYVREEERTDGGRTEGGKTDGGRTDGGRTADGERTSE